MITKIVIKKNELKNQFAKSGVLNTPESQMLIVEIMTAAQLIYGAIMASVMLRQEGTPMEVTDALRPKCGDADFGMKEIRALSEMGVIKDDREYFMSNDADTIIRDIAIGVTELNATDFLKKVGFRIVNPSQN